LIDVLTAVALRTWALLAYSGKYSFEMHEYDLQRGKAAQCLDVSNDTQGWAYSACEPVSIIADDDKSLRY
jgi:hypothetical protein